MFFGILLPQQYDASHIVNKTTIYLPTDKYTLCIVSEEDFKDRLTPLVVNTGFEEPEPPFLFLNILSGWSLSPLSAAHQLPFSPMSPSKSIFASSSLNMFTGLGINLSSMGSGGGVTI